MKLFLAASAAITLFALPAMAQSTTVEFASSDGTTALVVFYENGTASMDGGDPIPYTMDEESKTICGQTPEGDICATCSQFLLHVDLKSRKSCPPLESVAAALAELN